MSQTEAAFDVAAPPPPASPAPGMATPLIPVAQLQASRVAQADAAIGDLVRAHGLATPGDLMAALGVESLPRLLAMLGFTGDLPGLAREVAALVNLSPGDN